MVLTHEQDCGNLIFSSLGSEQPKFVLWQLIDKSLSICWRTTTNHVEGQISWTWQIWTKATFCQKIYKQLSVCRLWCKRYAMGGEGIPSIKYMYIIYTHRQCYCFHLGCWPHDYNVRPCDPQVWLAFTRPVPSDIHSTKPVITWRNITKVSNHILDITIKPWLMFINAFLMIKMLISMILFQ